MDDPFDNKSKDESDWAITWILNVDGSVGEEHKAAGFNLKDPNGHQFSYAMKFISPISNNEAKYEALVVGLEMAQILKITDISVGSNFEVVIGHVTGEFETREDNMKKYPNFVQHLVSIFLQILF